MQMNKTITTASLGLAVGLLAIVSIASADETVTTKTETTTYSGTVSEVNPTSSTIILRSETSPTPVTYKYSKETTFVDSTGKTVSYETIRNSPVRVEYTTVGGETIARRVVQTGPAVVVTPPAAGGVIREKTTTHTETHP
jgi:uncharacterized membrane protein